MKIYRGIQTNKQTQAFGESKACVYNSDPTKIITKDTFCPPGYQDLYQSYGMKGHNGWDHKVYYKEPLYFPIEADTEWWSKAEVDRHGGIGLDIYSTKRVFLEELPPQAGKLARREWEQNDKMVYIKFRFWHLQSVVIPNAKRKPEDFHPTPNVKLGDLIGYCDSTGQSSGHHLHWSMKIVAENSMTLDADNGYYGAVDFAFWFVNRFVKEYNDEQIKALQLKVIQLATQAISLLEQLIKKASK